MLISIQKDPQPNDVVAIKLVSGEELLAKLVSINGDEYTVEKPVLMHLVPVGNGQAQVQFAPFMLGLEPDAKITISYSKMVLRPVVARDDAGKQYIQSTTGIAL